jgi:ADP-ribosylglycohydrolase
MSTHEERLARAKNSLDGLSVGDSFGGYFFMRSPADSLRLKARVLPTAPWYYSDDTNMALSIYSNLRQYGEINQDRLAASFADRYDQSRGYGPAMRQLLLRIGEGETWRNASKRLFAGQGSFGNGGAMRVAPVGAYFADNMDAVVEQAKRSCEITHAHPEGIAGAIAVAVAAALAIQLRDTKPTVSDFLLKALQFIPESEVREKIRQASGLDVDAPVRLAVETLGNGNSMSAQNTVAFTLWCVAHHLDSYEDALWLTVSGGGDVDTNCAIVGGIVGAAPFIWKKRLEPIPNWPFVEIDGEAPVSEWDKEYEVAILNEQGQSITGHFGLRNASSLKLTLKYDDDQLTAIANDFFEALCDIRLDLEARGLRLHCYGASKNVYATGHQRDGGLGLGAFKFTLGQQPTIADLVSIFESGPDVVPATVAEQKAFFKEWLESVGSPLARYI